MTNPDVPNEVLVMDLEGMHSEHNFIMGKMLGTEVTISLSFHAMQRLLNYAIRAGIIVGTGSFSFYSNGHKRSTRCGKHTPKGTQTSMGTREESARKGSS